MKKFEDLEVYKKAFDLTIKIYKQTLKNSSFDYHIKNQIQRASLSIQLNIAEGFELQSNKQFIRFLYISKGSSGEVRSLLQVCKELELMNEELIDEMIIEVNDISKQLSNFINYLKNSDID